MANSPPQPLPLHPTLSALPPIHPGDLRAQTRAHLTNPKIPLLIALDDDPTGTQTCHAIHVLTVWDTATLAAELSSTAPGSGFFILTNSRALHPPAARALVADICRNLRLASQQTGVGFEIVLRGDSTLRGHFPDEMEVVEDELGGGADAWVLAPFFLQGGRYTVGDVHYVAEGDVLVPAGETAFARDATFGYKSSDLKEWVVEKSGGRIGRERVVSLGLEDIRVGGPERVAEMLEGFGKGAVVVVNAAAEEDMDVVVLGLLKGEIMPFLWVELVLMMPFSFGKGKALPFPHCCRLRLGTSGNLAHPSHLGGAVAAHARVWWFDHCGVVRPEDYCAAGGPGVKER